MEMAISIQNDPDSSKQNNDIEYYSALSFHARGQKLGDIWPISNLHLFHLSARCLPFYIFLTIFRVTSVSLVLVVVGGFYSIVLYFVLLSILLSGIFLSMLLDGENVAVLENLSRIRQQQGLVYLFMLPFRTILSTGTSAFLISLHLITGTLTRRQYSKFSGSFATLCWWSPSTLWLT